MEKYNGQTDIRVRVDTRQLQSIQNHIGKKSHKAITTASLTLLSWAINEVASGRIVVSANKQNSEIRQLMMPELFSPPT